MRDAIEFEWAGVPSVALVTASFVPAVQMMSRVSGMSGYPYVVAADGIGSMERRALAVEARALVPQILACLLRRDH